MPGMRGTSGGREGEKKNGAVGAGPDTDGRLRGAVVRARVCNVSDRPSGRVLAQASWNQGQSQAATDAAMADTRCKGGAQLSEGGGDYVYHLIHDMKAWFNE